MLHIIFVEGPDYAGKTSLVQRIVEAANKHGVLTRSLSFPSTNLRQKMKDNPSFVPNAHHFTEDIRENVISALNSLPEDEAPQLIICDRGLMSSFVYQDVRHSEAPWRGGYMEYIVGEYLSGVSALSESLEVRCRASNRKDPPILKTFVLNVSVDELLERKQNRPPQPFPDKYDLMSDDEFLRQTYINQEAYTKLTYIGRRVYDLYTPWFLNELYREHNKPIMGMAYQVLHGNISDAQLSNLLVDIRDI